MVQKHGEEKSPHMQEFSDDSASTRRRSKRLRRIIMGLHTILIAGLVIAIAVEGSYTDQRIKALRKDEGEEEQVMEEILNRSTQIKEYLVKLNGTQQEQYDELRQEMKRQECKIREVEARIKNLEENRTDDWATLQ
jgi:uncharacterized protein HemX